MSLKSALIILICLVVGLGGYGVWSVFFRTAAPSQQQGTLSDSTQYGGINNQTTVGIPTAGTGANGVEEVDPDAAYDQMLQGILGTKITYTSVASVDGEKGSVYALYANDLAFVKKLYPALAAYPMDIALLDLNEDGAAEAVVYENLPGFCGSGGCPFDIYRKQGKTWKLVFTALVSGKAATANTYTNGYLDLYLSVPGPVGYESNIVRFAWDGEQYQRTELMASWNGGGFNYPAR